jgi:hypothetical protein
MEYDSHVSLDPAEATRMIREIARIGQILLSKHCRNESMPSRAIDFQDVITILLNGEVNAHARYDDKTCQYKYKVEGFTVEEEKTVAVTVILNHRSVLVVTVF